MESVGDWYPHDYYWPSPIHHSQPNHLYFEKGKGCKRAYREIEISCCLVTRILILVIGGCNEHSSCCWLTHRGKSVLAAGCGSTWCLDNSPMPVFPELPSMCLCKPRRVPCPHCRQFSLLSLLVLSAHQYKKKTTPVENKPLIHEKTNSLQKRKMPW